MVDIEALADRADERLGGRAAVLAAPQDLGWRCPAHGAISDATPSTTW